MTAPLVPRGDLAPSRGAARVDVHIRSRAPAVPEPVTVDGRNIDRELGRLMGEAAHLKSKRPDAAAALGNETLANITSAPQATTTYYEQPVLKKPVWKAWIPAYFFVGGLAGGAAALGAAAQLVGGKRLAAMVVPARWIATGGIAVSAVLLTADLGRPSRFLYMLRVFRPTSPMNMGTWIITGAGASAAGSALLPFFGAPRLANVAGAAAGVLGLGLVSYTAVLIASTATPAWQAGRLSLPALFTASAAASAASALELVPGRGRRRGRASTAISIVAAAGKLGELAFGHAYEREVAAAGDAVVRHLRTGRAGRLLRLSRGLTATSLVTSLALRRSRAAQIAGAVLALGGAIALRFAVMEAGKSSAEDPRATFEPQRQSRASR